MAGKQNGARMCRVSYLSSPQWRQVQYKYKYKYKYNDDKYNTSPPYLSSASNTIQRQYVSKLFLSQKSQATAADIPPPVIFSERHTKQSTKLTRLI